MDSKPSGRSEHLKQYNNQSWECHATHQAKYGTPGVFPVVHLAKKNIPIRSITPNEISMHINIDESPSYYESKYCDAVEGRTHDNPDICYDNQAANINSHNLLDALKEISRKRIHSENEELHMHSLKQQRCSGVAANLSPNVVNSALQVSEIPPVINPINASLSSARTFVAYPRKGILKRKFYISTAKLEQKHALTQTDYIPIKKLKPKKIFQNKTQHKKSVKTQEISKDSTPINIPKLFDELQYAVGKKNKLSMLLSPLTGNTVKLLPFISEPEKSEIPEKDLVPSQTKPTSIISPKNKPKHDKHVTFAIPEKENIEDTSKNDILVEADITKDSNSQPTQVSNNEEKASDIPILTSTQDQIINPPSTVFSSHESKTPFVIPNNIAPVTHNIGSVPSPKMGGFKYDFKNNGPSPQIGSGEGIKPQFSLTSPASTNPQLMGSSLANMFASSAPTPFPQAVDAFFNNESVVKPKPAIDPVLNALSKFSSSSSRANTTVTSVGRSMLLSTGLGTSAIASSTSPTSALSFNATTSPKLNFDTNQGFVSTFGIKPSISSTPNPISSPTIFGSSDFIQASPNFNATSTTNFNVNPSSDVGLPTSNIFGSVLPINKPKPVEALPPPSTSGFNFNNNSFTSPIFSNNQFKSVPNAPATGFGDNKPIVTSNIFNTAISSAENNIFGTRNSNSMAGNFTGFDSTTPTSMYSLFTSTAAPTTVQPQSEPFTKSSNMAGDVFAFGNNNNNNTSNNNTGKFVLDNSTNNLFSGVPTSAFGSAVTSTLQPTSNSFSFTSNVGFNAYNVPNVETTTSRIFNIGSGSSYSKSRAQLRGRRRT